MLYFVMTKSCNLASFVMVAILAISTFSSLSLTSGCYGLSPVAIGMTSCRDFNIGGVVTS